MTQPNRSAAKLPTGNFEIANSLLRHWNGGQPSADAPAICTAVHARARQSERRADDAA
jgi:hypothetical protein